MVLTNKIPPVKIFTENYLEQKKSREVQRIGYARGVPHKIFGTVRQNCDSRHKIFETVRQNCKSPLKTFDAVKQNFDSPNEVFSTLENFKFQMMSLCEVDPRYGSNFVVFL